MSVLRGRKLGSTYETLAMSKHVAMLCHLEAGKFNPAVAASYCTALREYLEASRQAAREFSRTARSEHHRQVSALRG